MGGTTHRSPSDLCPLARICVITVISPLRATNEEGGAVEPLFLNPDFH